MIARAALPCILALLMLLMQALPAPQAQAQTLPIPGGLGGLSGPTTAERNADDTVPAANPTQALIDILRDETAREALIRELESAAGASAVSGQAEASQAVGGDAAEATVQPSFGERAVSLTRSIGRTTMEELEGLWLRIKRVPTTFSLALRAMEGDLLRSALIEVLKLAVPVYAVLLLLRLAVRPLRRRLARKAQAAGWIRTLFLRLVASALDLATLPLSVFLGVFLAFLNGILSAPGGEPVLTEAQALFINAFLAVEVARTFLRLILSPKSPELRLIRLPETGIQTLWNLGRILIYLLGFGQLLIVPIVNAGESIFVGRAIASVVSTVAVALVIAFVLRNRMRVADWLYSPENDNVLAPTIRGFARQWHWPVMGFLLVAMVIVMTRPGNVLLPFLQTTGKVIGAFVVGGMIISAITGATTRRLRIPEFIGQRLPLLEARINELLPNFLRVVRAAVVIVLILVVLEILGLQTFGGVLSSDLAGTIYSALFGVLLIVGALSIVWLAMASWVDYRLNPFVGTVPTPREITLLTLLRNAITVALVILGTITSLAQLGMNIGPLLASAGVIGLAISFGAQKMVEDVFSGIFIQAEGAMNVGDVVDVGGTVGTVEKLTVRSVTLRDLSGVVHIIPFSSAAKISNYMRDFAYHVADIGVAYREDIDDVRQAMHDAFDELRENEAHGPNIIGDLEWFGLNAFGPSELMMRARIKTVPGMQWGIGRAYNAIVKRIFDARGIEIPFPHQTLYFGEDKQGHAPALPIQMQRPNRDNDAQRPEPSPPAPRPRDDDAPPNDFPDSSDGR